MIHILQHVALFFSILVVDGLIRDYADLEMVQNYGFIFGTVTKASPYVRVVFLGVMYGIIGMISAFFYAFINRQVYWLKFGMTMLLSGMAGNSFEKILFGFVYDYFKFESISPYYFNLFDACQILGLMIIVVELFTKRDILWYEGGVRRKKILLYKEVQVGLALKVCAFVFLISVTQSILTMAMLFPYVAAKGHTLQVLYLVALFSINLVSLPLLGYFIVKEVLKCVAPIFALEKHLTENPDREFKMRKSDYFQSLEKNFNDFIQKIKSE